MANQRKAYKKQYGQISYYQKIACTLHLRTRLPAIIRTGTDGHRLHVPLCIHRGYVLYTFQGQSR